MLSLREITEELKRSRPAPAEKEHVSRGANFRLRRAMLSNGSIEMEKAEIAPHSTLDFMKIALQTAAQLEFSTVPPYLVALWSVMDENHPVACTLRAIAHEEMLHMALACNMLSAIGGVPQLTGSATPRYPNQLPGEVHPELTIALSGLTDNTLAVFLEIERPLTVVSIEGVQLPQPPDVDNTISEFYEVVKSKLRELNPEFSTVRQVAGPLAPMVVGNIDDCDKAIDLILRQGEGSNRQPFDTGEGDLAHYYRFLSVQLGRRLIWNAKRKILQQTDYIKPPSIYPVASPPTDGWGRATPARIRSLSSEFNRLYSELLDLLEQSWQEGGHRAFLEALERMFGMRELAREMIRTPGPGGAGYCPEFRYVASKAR